MSLIHETPVVFIAFEERENLGIRYMSAVLSEAGFAVFIVDFRRTHAEILEKLRSLNPLLVGFSVIFERTIHRFKELVDYLRQMGISCHFTAGGHIASLRPELLFEMLPAVNSIVRFEGEHTILELADSLRSGSDWTKIEGISYLRGEKLVHNKLRALETDLDRFPYPLRAEMKPYVLDKKHTTLLAGRGCHYNCRFCDTREFFRYPPGPFKRTRDPLKLVEEMAFLHNKKDCSVFLFEDEDFPISNKRHPGWTENFCESLKSKGLKGKIMWKISCRTDQIEESTHRLMKQHGLFNVFLGIEDGTEQGLKQMNKGLEPADTLSAIKILKRLDVGIEFGFMLFQPETSFNSLRENLDFLSRICGDGYMPVFFNKMLPFLETQLRKDLEQAGRLRGGPGCLDYDFYDREMNDLYEFTDEVFDTWITASDGLTNIAKWADNYLRVFNFYYGNIKNIASLRNEYRIILADTNSYLLDTLKTLSHIFESGNYNLGFDERLHKYRVDIAKIHESACMKISRIAHRVKLVSLVKEVFL